MLYAQLDDSDKARLPELLKTCKDVRLYRKYQTLILSGIDGKSVSEISQLLHLCEATIRAYIHQYTREGLSGLSPKYGIGRTRKIPLTKPEWEELLRQSPSEFSLLKTAARNWSQGLIVEYLACYHQVHVTVSAVCQHFQKEGIRWVRSRLKVTSPDPLYQTKRERITTLKKSS